MLTEDQEQLAHSYRSLEDLFAADELTIQNITDDQMKTVMEIMSFLLSHAESYENQKPAVGRDICNDLLWLLSSFFLISNQKLHCEAWLKEHLSELKAVRCENGDSLLHLAAERQLRPFPNASFVKLLLEEGEMDVNVVNIKRQTPLHYSHTYSPKYNT